MSLYLRNCRIFGGGEADIFISGGKIAGLFERGSESPVGAETVDCAGLTAFPGMIDTHCHLRDPGYTYKETIATGARAAAAGGFTSVACMANTNPVNDSPATTEYIIDSAKKSGGARVLPIAAVTKGFAGAELSDFAALLAAGAVAFSDDGKPVAGADMMADAIALADSLGTVVVSHCEVPELARGGCMNDGALSRRLGLKGIPATAESVMASRDILLAEYAGARVHIAHVSARQTIDVIRDAKARGVRVTCETCPHYFALTESACEPMRGDARVNPPLRTEDDRLAVIEALADGTIDALATDHAPHAMSETDVSIDKAASGISGFETAFAAAYTFLVEPGIISPERFIALTRKNPAAILGVPGGATEPGVDADLFLADLSETWTVDPGKFVSMGKNTPFTGMKLVGRVKRAIVAGKTEYSE